MNIYAVIIGTEILNGRREDKHFNFMKHLLQQWGHTLYASLSVKDDPELIRNIFTLVRSDTTSVMFSFGGIGSTPDDLTRQIAAHVFTQQPLAEHPKFAHDIKERFGDDAYPHRIQMAYLPQGAQLLFNPINNMSGFALQRRFFFVPGFPEMAHPMVEEAVKNYLPRAKATYRKTLIADTSENTLITTMQMLPESIELSSLPILSQGLPRVELSLSSRDANTLNQVFEEFQRVLQAKKIAYEIH